MDNTKRYLNLKSPLGGQTYDEWLRRDDVDAVAAMCRFFMEDDPVHHTLRKITAKLDELGVTYAVAGGMALGRTISFVRLSTWISWSTLKA